MLTSLAVQAAQLQETSQEYVLHTLNSMSQRLATTFQKFVDEQIRAIEDTKVKISKRKGVIAFMKIFPLFSSGVEAMYHGAAGRADATMAVQGARQMIDDAYVRINKAMWDSLNVIARAAPAAGSNADKDADKELLNYHILLIENMHHYIEEVDDGGKEGSVLTQWKARALMDRAEHMEQYVEKVVGRPLGKVMVCQNAMFRDSPAYRRCRTLSKKRKTCWPKVAQGRALQQGPNTRAARPRRLQRRTTRKKFEKASTHSGSVLRSTLENPTKSNSPDNSWDWCTKSVNAAMTRFWRSSRRFAGSCTKKRRREWISNGAKRTTGQDSKRDSKCWSLIASLYWAVWVILQGGICEGTVCRKRVVHWIDQRRRAGGRRGGKWSADHGIDDCTLHLLSILWSSQLQRPGDGVVQVVDGTISCASCLTLWCREYLTLRS